MAFFRTALIATLITTFVAGGLILVDTTPALAKSPGEGWVLIDDWGIAVYHPAERCEGARKKAMDTGAWKSAVCIKADDKGHSMDLWGLPKQD